MDVILFEDKLRTDLEPANSKTNSFDFYDTNAQHKIEVIRNLLNSWFASYPSEQKKSLKENFKNDFKAAVFELFIYELLIRQDFEVTIHPEIEGSEKTPDFLVKKNGVEFYVEAIHTDGRNEVEVRQDKFREAVKDELDKIDTPNFWLYLKPIVFKNANQPKISTVRKYLGEKLKGFDPELVKIKLELYGRRGFDFITYNDENVTVKFGLIPKTETSRGRDDFRAIGIETFLPIQLSQEQTAEPYRKAFKKKASRYGKLKKPYLIFINFTGLWSDLKHDVDYAFFGDNYEKGLFNQVPSVGTRVSGVFVTKLIEGNFSDSKHRLIKNPNAINPLNFDIFDLTCDYCDTSELVDKPKKTIGEILKLENFDY